MSLFYILAVSLLFYSPSSSAVYPFDTSYHIDCGGPTGSTDRFNTTWLSDRFFSGGSTGLVSEPLHFRDDFEKTLRFFPISYGKKNCYVFAALPAGRYLLRTFTVYDNYDGKDHPPTFDVSVEGTHVFSWQSPWPDDARRDGAYSDLFAFVRDGRAEVCFYSIATDAPVIAALELSRVDPSSYDSDSLGTAHLLVNYGRFSAAPGQWGPRFTNHSDLFGRSWQGFPSRSSKVHTLNTTKGISGADQPPDYFPTRLYQFAATAAGDGDLEYELEVDAKLDYLVWLHFVEIDPVITKAGQRVFDVAINGKNVARVDIVKQVGVLALYTWHCTVKNLSSSLLTVKLTPIVGSPLISGLENYAIVPVDLATIPEQVVAMRALKESLRVPHRMGWNGDPCAPTNWDAWEGVTCHSSENGSSLVITKIDLGSQGLKGYISDQIGLLTNLVSLNLSSNVLGGPIPPKLGQKYLKQLDLSNNKLSGSIPVSLTTSSLQLVLLNDNLLEGQVPEDLFSISVHGGAIDLTGNKGLCGGSSLPSCPPFWRNGSLSTSAKVAIGLSGLLFLFLMLFVIYICCIRRGNNDYDFGLPQDLMSLSAKRNKYQRQKSLMLLEMESQHAKGLPMRLPSR